MVQGGKTPLMRTVMNFKFAQDPELVELLLKAEADVNATDKVSA